MDEEKERKSSDPAENIDPEDAVRDSFSSEDAILVIEEKDEGANFAADELQDNEVLESPGDQQGSGEPASGAESNKNADFVAADMMDDIQCGTEMAISDINSPRRPADADIVGDEEEKLGKEGGIKMGLSSDVETKVSLSKPEFGEGFEDVTLKCLQSPNDEHTSCEPEAAIEADDGAQIVDTNSKADDAVNVNVQLPPERPAEEQAEGGEKGEEQKVGVIKMELSTDGKIKEGTTKSEQDGGLELEAKNLSHSYILEDLDGNESGTEEEQSSFMDKLETFYRGRSMEFKPPKFYQKELNLLKLWKAVVKLGGYDKVTACKLWRQVGESFRPPKTCTTVSWTFRNFYEKAVLEYERHGMHGFEFPLGDGSFTKSTITETQSNDSQALGSGRARRDAATRAMQGWHSQGLLGKCEIKNSTPIPKSEKQVKSTGLLKRKNPSTVEQNLHVSRTKLKSQADTMVADVGNPADWVKINVQRTSDCFEVYALVPGLLREEVHVQSDPAGRLVISGQPEQLDNPWGVTPFKKVVSLPSRIDPHQTSAVVTLHGQLFVRVPFEQPGQ